MEMGLALSQVLICRSIEHNKQLWKGAVSLERLNVDQNAR